MAQILLISGSPTAPSKSAALLDYSSKALVELGLSCATVGVLDFPAEDLIQARYNSAVFESFKAQVAEASGIIIATPIYKASYTGSLKALLDILPQTALRGKTLLPIATGGTMAHLLAIEYAFKPLLAVLGASDIQQGVYIVDNQFHYREEGGFTLDDDLQQRFDDSLKRLATTVKALPAK